MGPDDDAPEQTWSARTLRPVVILYVLGVFVGFMAVAHFAVHSAQAVKALFLTAIGSVAGLGANLLMKVEYRLTADGLAKRPVNVKHPREFKDVFSWDELSHVTPTSAGFKFYKRVEASGRFVRFLRLHVLDGSSGEVHVEPEDRARVRALVDRHGIPTSKPRSLRQAGPGAGG